MSDTSELVLRKRAGERVQLEPSSIEAWRPRDDALLSRLDDSRDKSPLPEDPPNEAEVSQWLLKVRRSKLNPK